MIIKFNEYIKENNSNGQFFKTYEETKYWLDKMEINNYTINPDLTVDVDGNVDISDKMLTKIPVKFGVVEGDFDCYVNNLTTLIGSPIEVYGSLYCSNNQLTTLIGSPKKVNHFFYCYDNPLTSLEGLSIFNFKSLVNAIWYNLINTKIKENYFDKHLEENPEIISLINFETTSRFKDKWNHLFNANKFDLI